MLVLSRRVDVDIENMQKPALMTRSNPSKPNIAAVSIKLIYSGVVSRERTFEVFADGKV